MLSLLLSLHFLFAADWPLADADKQYIESYVTHEAHDQAVEDARFAGIELTLDPIADPTDWGSFEIVLHRDVFYSEWWPGLPLAGLFSPAQFPVQPIPRIDLVWPRDIAAGGTWYLMAHELDHYLLLVNARWEWLAFKHGLNAPPGMDAYYERLKVLDHRAYPAGHSSDPLIGSK